MNRTEHERLHAILSSMGYTYAEIDALRRISNTLRRWYERECGVNAGHIERDDKTGRPYWASEWGTRYPIRDLERGALKRLAVIVRHPYYLQTDPRGAALYLLREGDVPDGKSVESYYSRGVCIY